MKKVSCVRLVVNVKPEQTAFRFIFVTGELVTNEQSLDRWRLQPILFVHITFRGMPVLAVSFILLAFFIFTLPLASFKPITQWPKKQK